MAKIFEINPPTQNPPQSSNQETQNPPLTNPPANKGWFSLPPALMNVVPWIPLMLEMTTGQKIPQMTGTIGEMQTGIQQIQFNLNQIITSQQALTQRITNLENSAIQQLTSLTQQFQTLRLTHTREKKEIAYNNPSAEEEEY